jgi:hypothetical protein
LKIEWFITILLGLASRAIGERDGDVRVSRPRPQRAFTSGLESEERLEGDPVVGAGPHHHLVRIGSVRGTQGVGAKDSTGFNSRCVDVVLIGSCLDYIFLHSHSLRFKSSLKGFIRF